MTRDELAGMTATGGRSLRDVAAYALEQAAGRATPAKASKYKARRQRTEDGVFDSTKELQRWESLKMLQRAGKIQHLERQVLFQFEINGVSIGRYTLDHKYFDVERNQWVYEDVKGAITRDFPLRKKLMRALFGITVEVWPERKKKRTVKPTRARGSNR